MPELAEPPGVTMDTAVVTRGDIFNLTVTEGTMVAASVEIGAPIDGMLVGSTATPGRGSRRETFSSPLMRAR